MYQTADHILTSHCRFPSLKAHQESVFRDLGEKELIYQIPVTCPCFHLWSTTESISRQI